MHSLSAAEELSIIVDGLEEPIRLIRGARGVSDGMGQKSKIQVPIQAISQATVATAVPLGTPFHRSSKGHRKHSRRAILRCGLGRCHRLRECS